jgi:hypothetical protein
MRECMDIEDMVGVSARWWWSTRKIEIAFF